MPGLRYGFDRLRLAEPFIFLTVIGITYLWMADAPAHYPWVNAGALLAATLMIFGLRPPSHQSGRLVLASLAVGILALTLVIGPSVMDVQRWLSIGPINLHIGMLVLPALCVLIPGIDDRISTVMVAVVALLLALQPDAGMGIAWAFAAIPLAISARSVWLGGGLLFSWIAWLYTANQAVGGAEDLPAITHVEGVFGDLFTSEILWFIPVAVMTFWLCFRISEIALNHAEGRALQSLSYGMFLAALMSNYPTPFVGYGAAPILGYGLAFGLMKMKRRGGGNYNDDFDTYE